MIAALIAGFGLGGFDLAAVMLGRRSTRRTELPFWDEVR